MSITRSVCRSLYAGGGVSKVTTQEIRQPGQNTDNDILPDSLDLDDDGDGVPDAMDAFPLDACASRDADNDSVPDGVVAGCETELTADAFPLDACASRDADNDSVPDGVVAGCETELTADAFPLDACASRDADNDSVPDGVVAGCETELTADNCLMVANPDQTNTDKMLPGGGDALGDVCDPDDDNDEILDETDVDDNNNGLRDIRTLDDLASLRDDLNGNGIDDGNFPEIAAMGSMGCPNSGCNGYELALSLNFSDPDSYDDDSGSSDKMDAWTDRSGSGWQPIGSCSDAITCTPYSAMFDGRGYVVADLFINASDDTDGVGLFAAFNGSMQNLHLLDANVHGGDSNAGLLVGWGMNARFENLSVSGILMSPRVTPVGGLVGHAAEAMIRHSYASDITVSGLFSVGGLAGNGVESQIRHSYVIDAAVFAGKSGDQSQVGGLLGQGEDAIIQAAYVLDSSVFGTGKTIGGLIGDGREVSITAAYVSGGSVAGGSESDEVGGLLGRGIKAKIRYSYVAVRVSSLRTVAPITGGLFGAAPAIKIDASYSDTQVTTQSTSHPSVDVSGVDKNTIELQSPSDFTGTDNIYADWGNLRCDPNTSEVVESTTGLDPSFRRLWDLGTDKQYPALNCMPGGVARQRQ